MKIRSKYKIARRLGPAVFEKTQTQKFAVSEQKKNKAPKFGRSRTNYNLQLIEKQRVRFTYGMTEKQLRKYVVEVLKLKTNTPADSLYEKLERRLDNIVLKSGFAKTRFQAKQMVSHGHILVDGKRTTVPSMEISDKRVLSVKESKKNSPLYLDLEERSKNTIVPAWLSVDPKTMTIKLKGSPTYKPTEQAFDLLAVIQFYNR